MTTSVARRKTNAPPKMSELDFQRALVGPDGLATMLGWVHVHFRRAQTKQGWRVPGSGQLIKGWPDLILVRGRDRRLIFAELKADDGKLTDDQRFVLGTLQQLEAAQVPTDAAAVVLPRIEVAVWRPRDLERIAEILR
jgi:VRR-NUC domain